MESATNLLKIGCGGDARNGLWIKRGELHSSRIDSAERKAKRSLQRIEYIFRVTTLQSLVLPCCTVCANFIYTLYIIIPTLLA